ncbi:MAG: SurA N-terminal domain-containing protein [Lepagella sp.]
MATLEKIRSKSVFLIIVIGVALLAFIVGDALTNSRNIFGDHTTVAKVGNTKVDYLEYQRKREDLNNQLEEARRNNPQQYSNFDTQILPEMAVEQLMQEALVLNAAEKADIRCTGNLLRFYMLDNPNNPEVVKVMRQLISNNISVQTPQQAYEVIFNPKRNGLTDAQVEPYQRAWLAAEKETERLVMLQTYQRLLTGLVHANDLDKKALYNDYVATSNVNVAFKPYGELNEKDYPVSDKEIADRYNQDKNEFMVEEPTREISFIAVTIMPSAADQKASKDLAAKTVASLSNGGQLSKDIKKEGVSVTRYALREKDIDPTLRGIVTTASADSAKIVSNDIQGFKVVRVVSRTAAVDSIQLNLVSVASEGLGKRILADLNGGKVVADSLMSKFSADSVATQLEQWIPLYTAEGETNALPKETLDSLRNAGGKYISIRQGAGQGMLIAQLAKQNAAVAVVEYDVAEYVLAPSTETRNSERSKFEKFLGANNTVEKFTANAAKAGYTLQQFVLTSSTPAVPRFQGMNQYYPESRQVVRWAMIDGEKGEVSHIYNSNDATRPAMYAAVIEDAYEDYAPVTNKAVREEITARVRADKAGDKMLKEYSGKSKTVESAAQAMKVEMKSYPKMRFALGSGVGDARLVGRISGAKADKKVNITKGTDGIYVYQVVGHENEKFPYNADIYDRQYAQFVNIDMVKMLQGTKRVQNNVYKFEAGE